MELEEEEYLDNPSMAKWDALDKNRALFDGEVDQDIEFEKVYIDERGPTLGGGPCITITDKLGGIFHYTTAEGKRLPYTKSTLFTWTSKMSCPSFSLPAGPGYKGTCPAANRESVEREGSYVKFHPPLPVASNPDPDKTTFVCDVCYAGKGRYLMYKSMSLGQVAKFEWVKKTLRAGSFARRMTEAIASLVEDEDVEELLRTKLVSNKFFRIHDSGDFFAPEYYRAWVEVCEELPEVFFWAPTRMWVYEKWRKVFQNYPPPKNLSLRPSALFLSAPPPMIKGMAAGTTSIEGRMDSPVKNCPAYEGEAEHSCAAARCRTCWVEKERPVNYLTH